MTKPKVHEMSRSCHCMGSSLHEQFHSKLKLMGSSLHEQFNSNLNLRSSEGSGGCFIQSWTLGTSSLLRLLALRSGWGPEAT